MMLKKIFSFLLAAQTCALVQAAGQASDFQFGILSKGPDGKYRMQTETTVLPKHLKSSGFRFGVAFANQGCQHIEWYEVIHLPSKPKHATGNLGRVDSNTLKTSVQSSEDCFMVDDFWFDEGDPLGKHKIDIYVNDQFAYSFNFEVVEK